MGNRLHVQHPEQPHTGANRPKARSAHNSIFQSGRHYKPRHFAESVQIMESNLNHKTEKRQFHQKPKGTDGIRWLGQDNEIVEVSNKARDKGTAQELARTNSPALQIKQNEKGKRAAKASKHCLWFDGFHSVNFLDGASPSKLLRWFSRRDRELMELMARGSVLEAGQGTRDDQTVCVVLSTNNSLAVGGSRDQCRAGACGLVKGLSDLREVTAFHLHRILGLNISQPVVARRWRTQLLPQQYTDGSAKPVVWWDPRMLLLQGTSRQKDTFRLAQFPSVFRKCQESDGGVCVQENSLELLNYFIQNINHHEVADGGAKFINIFQKHNLKDVEIILASFNRASDKRTFTFNDLDWLPLRTLKVISSQCLPEVLLCSLYEDQEYWQSKGQLSLSILGDRIRKRAQLLLQQMTDGHIKHKRAYV
ncbi:Golgi-associated kinase 1A-like [Hypanus sabinus]|uniref:Golgi-associated kinase 1A-like n=1 Tax=Hypanus sabinus TaxID=79690 RepID=UPI0028C50DCA|nr:Golgi-associated kinase 1A-like [Hypanus sabinus]